MFEKESFGHSQGRIGRIGLNFLLVFRKISVDVSHVWRSQLSGRHHRWDGCAQPAGIKNFKGSLARKSPSEQESESLLGPWPEKEIFGELVCDIALIFHTFEVLDANTVGSCWALPPYIVSGQLLLSFRTFFVCWWLFSSQFLSTFQCLGWLQKE